MLFKNSIFFQIVYFSKFYGKVDITFERIKIHTEILTRKTELRISLNELKKKLSHDAYFSI